MALISIKNVNKRTPLSYVRFKRVFNVGLVPVIVITLKGLWEGSDVQLNKILLIITVTLPGLLEVIGMLVAPDEMQVETNQTIEADPPKKDN